MMNDWKKTQRERERERKTKKPNQTFFSRKLCSALYTSKVLKAATSTNIFITEENSSTCTKQMDNAGVLVS